MKKFELTILGSNSAMPAYGRFPTSQVLNINEQLLLIDCGEACQIRISQYKIKRNKISHIFISHLHGDHVFGLPGLLGSMDHLGRKSKIKIIGPHGIKEFLSTIFKLSEANLQFEIDYLELKSDTYSSIEENTEFKVHSFPVDHRIPCFGYTFEEQNKKKNIRKEAISKFNLSIEEIKQAKLGLNVIRNEILIKNSAITHPSSPPRSYAYCADSRPNKNIIPYIKNVDWLYFESTYLHELAEAAHERGHSTALQAAEMAMEAEVQHLIIGHYSSRYKDVSLHLAEAKTKFKNTHLAYDGAVFQM